MSNRWKATLPKTLPEGNNSNFIIGTRDSMGARIELAGVINNESLTIIINQLILNMGKKPKTNK